MKYSWNGSSLQCTPWCWVAGLEPLSGGEEPMCTGPPWKNHKLSPATHFLSPPRTDNAQAGPPSCHLPLHCLRETGQEVQNKLDGSSPWENETGKRQQRSLAKACIWQMGMCTRYVTVSPKQLYFSNCSTTLVREMLSILIARMPVCEKPDQTWQSREKGGNESQVKYCSHTVTHWCLASIYQEAPCSLGKF